MIELVFEKKQALALSNNSARVRWVLRASTGRDFALQGARFLRNVCYRIDSSSEVRMTSPRLRASIAAWRTWFHPVLEASRENSDEVRKKL